MVTSMKTRLVIYTVLTGMKEPPGHPLGRLLGGADTDLDIDFVCFTDAPELLNPVWTARTLPTSYMVGEKASRLPKALPHRFFPEHDYSLYIDNIVEFKRLPRLADLQAPSPYLFKLFQHSGRQDLLSEAEAIIGLGFDEVEPIARQLEHYRQYIDLAQITPLSTCTVMLRQHHHPQVKNFGEQWWQQILSFSKRDQMSFDFVRLMTRTQVEYLLGNGKDNDLVYDQSNLDGSRILANFDDSRYVHIHGLGDADRQAVRGHYRRSGPSFEASLVYARRNCLLEYHAAIRKSSLGQWVSPRRGLASYLGKKLAPLADRKAAAVVLGLHPREGAELDWTAEEMNRATQAIAQVTRAHQFTLALFDAKDWQAMAYPLTRVEAIRSVDLLILFNMNAAHADKLAVLLAGLTLQAQGVAIVLSDEDSQAQWLSPLLQALSNEPLNCRQSSTYSLHDLCAQARESSVHCIEWRSASAAQES